MTAARGRTAHRRQRKVFKSLQDWQKEDPTAIRDALTEKMIDAGSKLALFVGFDAYIEAGGTSRADLFGEEVYLEKPALLNKLAEKKLNGIRHELEAEGWGWIELNPERDWHLINKCTRIKPQLIDAPSDLLELKSQLDRELEMVESQLDDAESEALLEQQQTVRDRLVQVEERLVAFVGFDADHKPLAGCFVSVGQDGAPFIEKGLVRPEQRKQLAKLLNADNASGTPVKAKSKGPLSESLRKDLAACRLQVAQVEIAKHPLLAFDLLVFQVAQALLDERSGHEAAEIEFKRPRQQSPGALEPTTASRKFEEIAQALPRQWLTPEGEAARFEAFRLLPETSKLDILAYCMALILKPKLAPAKGDEITAYDIALSLTGASVSDYWRPTAENFLGRITREQLLAISRAVFGDAWAQSHGDVKKATLVNRLHGAFSKVETSGQTPQRMETLKRWLPEGMAFDIAGEVKPAKVRRIRKAA